MISLTCTCGRAITVRPELAGKKIKCSNCQQINAIPGTPPLPAAPAAPEAAPAAVGAPGPVSTRRVVRSEGGGSWKAVAAGGVLIGLISLAVNIYLVSRHKGDEKPASPSAESAEVQRLRQALTDRSKEVESLRDLLARGEDPARYEKVFRRIQILEEDNKKGAELLTLERNSNRQLQDRIRELESAKSADPSPTQALQPATVPVTKPTEPKSERERALSDLVEKCSPSVVVVRTDVGAGAGFFITTDGFLGTNYHVISGARTISVEQVQVEGGAKRRAKYPATAYAIDLKNDLALLKVAVLGEVPAVQFEAAQDAKVGDAVFAIGNPGVGSMLLEMSVSNGILSSLSRQIEDRRFLQTTTPINPGNSGGPLFTMTGKVVGIVTAKASDKENIGFAVPGELLQLLYQNREGPNRVKGSLSEWENKNGLAAKVKYDPARAVVLDTIITRMMVDEDNDRILAIEYESNSVLVISQSQRKVLQKIFTGSEPSALHPVYGQTKQVWVANRASQNLVRLDLEKGAVVETLGVTCAPATLLATSKNLWCQDLGGQLYVVNSSDKKAYATQISFTAITYDSRRDKLLGANSNALYEIDAAKLPAIAKEISLLKPQQFKERQALMQETQKVVKQVQVPPSQLGSSAVGYGLLLDSKSNRLYFRRQALKADHPESMVGAFKANPYSLSADGGVRNFMARYPFLDEIMAVSPDGKWASNGTHIFSAATFTVQKEIPVPTTMVAFSKDSKALYYFDWVNQVIAAIEIEGK